MNVKDDYAFPSSATVLPTGQVQEGYWGMTLRDYFAARFAGSMVGENDIWASGSDHRQIAKTAYQLADAMLAERAK